MRDNLRGDSADLDDVLHEVKTLQRIAIGYLPKRTPLSASKDSTSNVLKDRKILSKNRPLSISKDDSSKNSNGKAAASKRAPVMATNDTKSRNTKEDNPLTFAALSSILKFLGEPPRQDEIPEALLRYQQRYSQVKQIAPTALETCLSLLKSTISAGEVTWKTLDDALQDSLLLLSHLEARPENPNPLKKDQGNLSSLSVRISNTYWVFFVKNRQVLCEKENLKCLQRSVEALKSRNKKERTAGFFAVKLERLGGFYQSIEKYPEAIQALSESIDAQIECGTLKLAAAAAASKPPRDLWVGSSDISAFGRTLKTLFRLSLNTTESKKSPEEILFDDFSLELEERGIALELQLEVLLGIIHNSYSPEKYRPVVLALSSRLLSIYGIKEYPVRHIRVAIRFIQLASSYECFNEAISADEWTTNVSMNRVDPLGNDEGLVGFLDDLTATALVCKSFKDGMPEIDALQSALRTWSVIVNSADTWGSLVNRIERVDVFLEHLQLIADFLDMKGLGELCCPTLCLITKTRELETTHKPAAVVKTLSSLALQYLKLGYSGKAALQLAKAKPFVQEEGFPADARLIWQIAYAQYFLDIGNLEQCETFLTTAQSIAQGDSNLIKNATGSSTITGRSKLNRLIADASHICSQLAFEKGNMEEALVHAKRSVKLNYRIWASLENRSRKLPKELDVTTHSRDPEALTEQISKLSTSDNPRSVTMSSTHESLNKIQLWPLVSSLYSSQLALSYLFAHQGMFTDAVYYAEQGRRVANAIKSTPLITHNLMTLGNYWIRRGDPEKGGELLLKARDLKFELETSRMLVDLQVSLGGFYKTNGHLEKEFEAYEDAEKILERLLTKDFVRGLEDFVQPSNDEAQSIPPLNLDQPLETQKRPALRKVKLEPSQNSQNKRALKSVKVKVAAPPKITLSEPLENPQLARLKGDLLRHKAQWMVLKKDWEAALGHFAEAEKLPKSQQGLIWQNLGLAKQLLYQGLDQMSADAVYCVLQDSTISLPSVLTPHSSQRGPDKSTSCTTKLVHSNTNKKSPKQLVTRKDTRVRAPGKGFLEILNQSRDHIDKIYSLATRVGSTSTIYSLSSFLVGLSLLLSAISTGKPKEIRYLSLAAYPIEMARLLAFEREKQASQIEHYSNPSENLLVWPASAMANSASELEENFSLSQSTFQKEYIDIIPYEWTAISLSLNESRDELFISKLQAGRSPFILRLPLGRHNSRDADEEIFDFAEGSAELKDIVSNCNESTHENIDMTRKGAKSDWWARRSSLDSRLKDLLLNIENIWLGGFKGVFSQNSRHTQFLAQFQASFQSILKKHLPSRQRGSRGTKCGNTVLDSHILELLIGLIDVSRGSTDLEEPLTDLLYFVIDILQFHGEHNAYDEIDFDSIVVETQDSLRSYYEACKMELNERKRGHTILILDKPLQNFPWESIPCLDGLSISRVPSLSCLRERILLQQRQLQQRQLKQEAPPKAPNGLIADRTRGTYVLNPAGDLKATQATFEEPLEGLKSWTAIAGREPRESEVKEALIADDIFLYFGHGSGTQFIRNRTIRKLDKCAVALLMGCSSGTLADTGEFETFGTPISYMHAGCPALVATLWDVTDKDIDRFAADVFTRWGLFDGARAVHQPTTRNLSARGKQKCALSPLELRPTANTNEASLTEAVAMARGACILRYLNGAAPVVYGIPVFLS
ncbi:MAG: hypothetical protein M1829_003212 [Trizodia sp. TS-e1964]|nr:MAG: hypothetical protein M1829_003212 [Trizodia sp. TS-e1964]